MSLLYYLLLSTLVLVSCGTDPDWPPAPHPDPQLPMPRPQPVDFRPSPVAPAGWWEQLNERFRNCGRERRLLQKAAAYDAIRLSIIQVVHPVHAGEFNTGQLADLFDYIDRRWVYVSDPININDIQRAAGNWGIFRGDCEDAAVMMSAAIHAVGGETRIIYAFGPEGGHAYAEVNVGKDPEAVNWYIRARYRLPEEAIIQFTPDEFGQYWLPLDTSWDYPGGGPTFEGDTVCFFYLIQGHCEIIKK